MPKKYSKRLKKAHESLSLSDEGYKLQNALEEVEKYKSQFAAKFVESVSLTFTLSKAFNSSQDSINGSFSLPCGLGNKQIRVIAFVTPGKEKEAIEAGAIEADIETLSKKIQDGFLDFDVCVATPDVMPKISKLAKILGPRGLMPSPKNGMLTTDFQKAIKNAISGMAMYKASKNGCISFKVGSLALSNQDLLTNVEYALSYVKSNSKNLIDKTYISTTQGLSWQIS